MAPIISLLILLYVLLLVHRVSSTLLELTGLSRDSSRLQALSALTGTGFTTKESELIIGHPIRRRIVMFLMLVGNTGIVTVMASVVVGYIELRGNPHFGAILLWGLVGVFVILFIGYSPWLNRLLERLVINAAHRWANPQILDYSNLLQVGRGFSVCTRSISKDNWIVGKPLVSTQLRSEGVIVLGLFRKDGTFEGTPNGSTILHAGDTAVFYGRLPDIQRVSKRGAGWTGDHDHQDAVAEHGETIPKS